MGPSHAGAVRRRDIPPQAALSWTQQQVQRQQQQRQQLPQQSAVVPQAGAEALFLSLDSSGSGTSITGASGEGGSSVAADQR